MANNRIYLRCRTCGKGFFIGKGFGGPYSIDNVYFAKDNRINAPNEPDAFLDALNEFYEEHCFCENDLAENDIKYLEPKFKTAPENMHYENNFEIAYETFYEGEE